MATKTPGKRISQGKRRPRRRRLGVFIGVVLIVALAAAGYQLMGPTAKAARPKALAAKPGAARGHNVVLITLDTTRADRIGCYGYAAAETPNLDALAAGGVRVADGVSCVPMTLPAHASILTARYPANLGVRANRLYRLGDEHETLAELLQAKGYATAAFVGSFVLDQRYGLEQGFATYDDDITLRYRRPGVRQASPQRPGDAVVDAALRWLDGQHNSDPDRPFFLWVHLFDPHAPYTPPEPFRTRFSEQPYDGEIAFADQQVGRLIDRLGALGLTDRSLVVVAGDHGEGLGEHNEPTHSLLVYGSTMRIPLILYAPGTLPAGIVVDDRVVAIVDIMPTILELLGETVPDADGISLLSGVPADRAVFLETLDPRLNHGWAELYALRTHTDKYIKAPTPEYYDLRADPGETENRIEARAARANELADRLDALLAKLPSGAAARPTLAPDSAALAKLAALGYVGTQTAEETRNGPRPDPKEEVAEWYAHVAQAVKLVDRGRFPEVIEHIQTFLKRSPYDPRLWDQLATAQAGIGKLEQALHSRKKTIALQPEDANHWIQMAHLQRRLKDAEAAEAALSRAAALQPDHGEIYLLRAKLAADAGDFERAFLECRQARRRDPTRHTAMSWSVQGTLFDRLNRPRAAKAAYERAYAADPLDSGALLGLALVATREGRPGRAVEVANRILRGERQWFGSRPLLARAYVDLGKGEDAVRTMTEMISALPGRAGPHSDLGNVFLRLGRIDEAIRAYKTALQFDPRYASAHSNMGNALEQLSRVDEALQHYKAAVEINPRLRPAQLAIARIDTEAGRLADALRRIEPLVSSGAVRLQSIESDPRLAALVRDPRFKQLEKYRTRKQP